MKYLEKINNKIYDSAVVIFILKQQCQISFLTNIK